ncbi:N-acetyl-gamma-glutamyl-phosphate reductase [Mobiluncus porci]|uniref:N-acetyl-gamma-glutamyl-phosphate reductase n=1 Tax=Mobiluncus porci TaxID=2652278 RepID=A0A7K0K3P4_9ACTO|nr:N-acetyl-gamma-glutamyl-phosphate reductase [Mobiluncus porci]MST50102.1 N-acetyl-gamma-glutamyl-phosphate reductase [Mobiluncus porci]
MNDFNKVKVAVAGASGSAGGEILRLLLGHPSIEIGALTASSSVGEPLRNHHPHLFDLANRILEPTDSEHLRDHDVIFLGLPHGASAEVTNALRASGSKAILIDAGADHRLTDPQAWRDYYHSEPAEPWTYSMPELLHQGETRAKAQREALAGAREIAVPGCNVTAVTLALQPAVAAGLIDPKDIVANLAVGYSGAGKGLKPHLMMLAGLGNAQGYSMAGTHRHIPEIIQNLQVAGAGEVKLSFTPVLVPMNRGILATVTAPLTGGKTAADLRAAYQATCEPEPLLEFLPEGIWPTLTMVTGSAKAAIQVAVDERAGKVVAQCAIDNLGKGTACAAIQGMNLALGLPELTGVPTVSTAP